MSARRRPPDAERAVTLEQLFAAKEIVVFCGSGGVGKTSVAAAAALGATVNSAFAHGHGGYRPSYGSYHQSYGSYQPYYDSYQPSYDYNAYDDSSDYGYGSSYGWDHHGGYGHFSGGHDRRR